MLYLTASEAFLILILVLIPAVVYIDATDHRIGRHPAAPGSISAGAWAFWTLIPFLGPAVAFCYFIARKGLIQRAETHPAVVSTPRRNRTSYLILAASLASYGWVAGYARTPHPARFGESLPPSTAEGSATAN